MRQSVDHYAGDGSAKDIIAWFGGYEMVMAIGGMLRAAELRMIILVDGFIMTNCILAASKLHPEVLSYAIFGHQGDETGHKLVLDAMKVRPLLNLGLRLGEGTGAICAYPIVVSSVNMMNEMDNFAHASITKYFDHETACLPHFFTRLPFWKIADVPPVYFKRVVDYWPFVGWLTGGIMAGTLWITAEFLPVQIAVLMALAARLLVTGALHEDGLADFCDGFGGGTSRDKILSIMKDSHIGTYGVLGLLFYYGLMWNILTTLSVPLACAAILSGDAWSKFCAAQIINTLPYARKEEESKAKVIYDRMSPGVLLSAFMAGALPMLLLLDKGYWWAAIAPAMMFILLMSLMRRRLQGYTGDCCGATFLLCEFSFYLTINLIYTNLW